MIRGGFIKNQRDDLKKLRFFPIFNLEFFWGFYQNITNYFKKKKKRF
jgi:hypothetical protein